MSSALTSQLSAVPVERRRRAAAAAGLFATLLLVVGIIPWLAAAPGAVRALASIALVGSGLLGLIGWGLVTSVRAELAERRLDAAVADTIAAAGVSGPGCGGCGHNHDPDTMDVCPSVGACQHNCAACLLHR